jgi:hypothetical protein
MEVIAMGLCRSEAEKREIATRIDERKLNRK